MDYLTPNLYRVLQPGRIAAIHVKDRIVPMGFPVWDVKRYILLHLDMTTSTIYRKHGFALHRYENHSYRCGKRE